MTGRPVFVARFLLLAVGAATSLTGCGQAPAETAGPAVVGRVAIKDSPTDTQRLEGGKVWFRSTTEAGREAVGVIDHDGSFTLGTHQGEGAGRTGVPPGEYVARIEPPTEAATRAPVFHPKYKDYKTSGLRFTVPASGDLTIELDRPRR